jgi:ABC-type glycerol-3-phosphate transport system substrate-binding protein
MKKSRTDTMRKILMTLLAAAALAACAGTPAHSATANAVNDDFGNPYPAFQAEQCTCSAPATVSDGTTLDDFGNPYATPGPGAQMKQCSAAVCASQPKYEGPYGEYGR